MIVQWVQNTLHDMMDHVIVQLPKWLSPNNCAAIMHEIGSFWVRSDFDRCWGWRGAWGYGFRVVASVHDSDCLRIGDRWPQQVCCLQHAVDNKLCIISLTTKIKWIHHSVSEWLWQIYRNSLKAFLRYCLHRNDNEKMDRQTPWKKTSCLQPLLSLGSLKCITQRLSQNDKFKFGQHNLKTFVILNCEAFWPFWSVSRPWRWGKLNFYVSVFQALIETGKIPLHINTANMTIILKPEKDSSYHPATTSFTRCSGTFWLSQLGILLVTVHKCGFGKSFINQVYTV